MDPLTFNNLLFRGESETLEFKSDNYSLDNDDEKGEFLKDLMAFVNAWRDTDAYILLGVKGSSSGVEQVAGMTKDRDDNEFQTLARGKITPAIRFGYETVIHDGKKCGVIHIPVQNRPAFLTKDFGKLKANDVHIRRGSATSIAAPDEISRMGAAAKTSGGPKFEIIARPGVGRPQMIPFVCLDVWLRNNGEETAYEVTVDIVSDIRNHLGFSNANWESSTTPTARERFIARKPLHREDMLALSSWRLDGGKFELDDKSRQTDKVIGYTGSGHEVCLRIFAKHQPPITFWLQFSSDEIREKKEKRFAPAT
jgi:hypothetical protein